MKHIGCFATQKEEREHLRKLKGEEKYEALNEMIAVSKHIAFFGGAGVSTESGIPDFRSKDGLYNQKYDYPPETILSHTFFMNKTEEFFKFYKDKLNSLKYGAGQ